MIPPRELTAAGKRYFESLVELAKNEYAPVEADVAPFTRAALGYEQLLASAKIMQELEKGGAATFKQWREAQKANLEAGRMLGAALTALKLAPDVRSKKAGKKTAAEEADAKEDHADDWGDDLA